MKLRTHLTLAVSILCLSAVALSGCGSAAAPVSSASAAQPPQVKVFSLQSVSTDGVSGKIDANQTVKIYSKLPGRIAKINVEEGSQVKKGDVLVQLDTADLEQQVNEAKAGLDAAKAKLADTENGARQEDLEAAQGAVEQAQAAADQAQAALSLAEKTYSETQNGYDQGDVSKSEMDKVTEAYQAAKAGHDQAAGALLAAQAKYRELKAGATASTLDALKAGVASAQAAYNLAKLTLQEASITSPIDGIVVKKYANAGEMAFTSMPSGTELLELVSMDPVQVIVSVPEAWVNQLKVGETASIALPSLPNQNFQGTVTFISPVSDPNNNTFPVKLTVKNPNYILRAGSVADVYFSNGQSVNRLEVPQSAVFNKNGKTYVYKLDGDTIHPIEVQTQPKNSDWVYVNEGSSLKNNDKIVLSPSAQLSDGMKVTVE